MSLNNLWVALLLCSIPFLTSARPAPDPDPNPFFAASFGVGWPYYGSTVRYTYYPWYYPFGYYVG